MTGTFPRRARTFALAALAALAGVACRAALAVELLTSCEKPGGWTFDVTRDEDADGRAVFTVSLKASLPEPPPTFDAYLTASGADAHNCWVSISEESERSRLFASEWGTTRYTSALAQMPPICCVFNESDENRLLVAASECRRTVKYGISCHSTDARLEGRFRFFTQPEAPRTSYEVKILVDRRAVPFGTAVAEATRWIERTAGLTPCRVPEVAFEPLYSSWYAFWQDVRADELDLAAPAEAVAHDVFGNAVGTSSLARGLQRVDCPVSGYLSLSPARGAADAAPSPEEVFANPPPQAHVGVWWHWMGRQVSEEGVVRDLDWMARMGVTSATIFGLADATVPWAKRIANVPTDIGRPYSDAWWKCVRRACAEGKRRGIEIGLHNCPGYTHTGGAWIPPRLAMRELVFGVRDPGEIPLEANALFPVFNEDAGRYEKPDCAARRTDVVPLGTVRGVPVAHVPMGAFVQPCDWANRGLECDKMSREAVRFHLDAVFGELHRQLGPDLRAAGLTHILLDSYEAGTPTWTPEMPEEFRRRRGYDPMPYLPILGGYTNLYTVAEADMFRRDFDRTVKDLYRDVLFAEMGRRVRAEGLELSCEPYGGPFATAEALPHVDRPMTEFWFAPDRPAKVDCRAWARLPSPKGGLHNVIEAEAFTGAPEATAFTETPLQLKRCGDGAYLGGVNRLVLHSVVHQPWGDDVRPGVTMGRWGVHFGRNQVWGAAEKAWFDYCHRCQAVLQWGRPSEARLDVPFGQIARTDGRTTVHFLVNASGTALPLAVRGKWLDPASGRVTRAPAELAPTQSGFLIPGDETGLAAPEPYDAARFEPEATWAELLEADDAEPDDLAYEAAPLGGAVLRAYPDWFDGGLSNRPTKRRWFSTWRHAK